MNGNPMLNRMIRQTIYDLKHRFGGEVTVYKVVDSNTDYKTGAKTIDTTSQTVRKAIILPNMLTREVFQGVNYLAASKSFTSLGGQGWDEATRGFIFDGRDLLNYQWELEDWIVYRGKRYDIESIEALEWDTGWLIVGKEVKGQISGGGPRIIIESGSSDFALTDAVTGSRTIPRDMLDEVEFSDESEAIRDIPSEADADLAFDSMVSVALTGEFLDGGESDLNLGDVANSIWDFLREATDSITFDDDASAELEVGNAFAAWAGYAIATPDNPASTLTDFTLYIDLSLLPDAWWTVVDDDGEDILAALDDGETRLPLDLIYFDKPSKTGLVAVRMTKGTGSEPIRLYAGNAGASLPADGDTYGRENAYASHVVAFWPDGAGTDRTGNDNDVTMTGSMSVGGAAGPFTSAKASDYDGSTNYGVATAVVPSTEPASLMCWYNTDITTGNQVPLHINDGFLVNANGLELRLAGATDTVEARSTAGGGTGSAVATANFATTTWESAFASCASPTSRSCGLNGGNFGSNSTSRDAEGMNQIVLGAIGNSAQGGKFNGRLSLMVVHDVAVSDDWYAYWHLMGNQATFWNGWAFNYAGWAGYAEATPDNPSESQTDFTFLIDLAELPSAWWDEVKSDGGDVRASKADGTALPCDLIYFDYGSQAGLLAVKYTGTKTTSNQAVRVYSGNPDASLPDPDDTYGQYNAYDSSWRGFWPSGAGNDRTTNALHLTNTSITEGDAAGPLGNLATTYVNNSDSARSVAAGIPANQPISFIAWGRATSASILNTMMVLEDTAPGDFIKFFWFNSGSGQILRLDVNDSGGANAAGPAAYVVGDWTHIAGTTTTTSRKCFKDGVVGTENTTSKNPTSLDTFTLGNNALNGDSFVGEMSLVQLHVTIRAESWITYQSGMSNQAGFWNGWNWNEQS